MPKVSLYQKNAIEVLSTCPPELQAEENTCCRAGWRSSECDETLAARVRRAASRRPSDQVRSHGASWRAYVCGNVVSENSCRPIRNFVKVCIVDGEEDRESSESSQEDGAPGPKAAGPREPKYITLIGDVLEGSVKLKDEKDDCHGFATLVCNAGRPQHLEADPQHDRPTQRSCQQLEDPSKP